jgi:hypothetical protein
MSKYFIQFTSYFGVTTDNLYGQDLSFIQLNRLEKLENSVITSKKIFKL